METTTTAKVLAQRLSDTAEKYHRGEVTHEAFTEAQRVTWDHIHSLHRDEEAFTEAQRVTWDHIHSLHRDEEAFTEAQRVTWDHIHSLHRDEEVLAILGGRYSIAEVRS
jgi:hypothetical protein